MSSYDPRDLDYLPASALLKMRARAIAMRDLVAQHLNSGPGGLYGRLDRLVHDIESARYYPEDEESPEDEHFLARKLAEQMNATDPIPGIDY